MPIMLSELMARYFFKKEQNSIDTNLFGLGMVHRMLVIHAS